LGHVDAAATAWARERPLGASLSTRPRTPRPPLAVRPSFVSQETSFAVLGLPPRKFLEALVPRCQDDVVRIGRTVLLPIEAAEAALRSLRAEASVTVQEEERGDEQPESVDAVLASVNMKRSA
jgi:hypothetical protein